MTEMRYPGQVKITVIREKRSVGNVIQLVSGKLYIVPTPIGIW